MHCRLAFARRAAASSFGGGRSRPGRGLTRVGATSRGFRGRSPQPVTAVPELCKHGAKSKVCRSTDEETRERSNPARWLHRNNDDHHHDCDVNEPFPNESLPRNRSTAVPRHGFVLSVDRHILRKVRFGVLTGGGDCPGLNAVIRAIIRKGERVFGDEIIGFVDAWEGVMSRRTLPITVESMRGTLPRGGTVLGATRGSPLDSPDGVDRVRSTISEMGIDGLIIIGGNGSLTVGEILFREHGIPVLGVPKTIDNDIEGTDLTFGFNTAVQIATDAIDRLHTTAESHDRVMVVEVMGRHSGWIATHAGLAGGAAVVLIPERPFDIDEVCERLVRRHSRGRFASIVVVAEGSRPAEGTIELPDQTRDEYGHVRLGGIGSIVAAEIGLRTGFETRPVLLGHVQRGGTPTAFDRVLSTRFGVAAVDAAREGKWGSMVALRDNNIVTVPLAEAAGRSRTVDLDLVSNVAEMFFA